MSPYRSQYSFDGTKVKYELSWVISQLGPEHFEYKDGNFDNRRVLSADSKLKIYGI